MTLPSEAPFERASSMLVTDATDEIRRAILDALVKRGVTVFARGRNNQALGNLADDMSRKGAIMDLISQIGVQSNAESEG